MPDSDQLMIQTRSWLVTLCILVGFSVDLRASIAELARPTKRPRRQASQTSGPVVSGGAFGRIPDAIRSLILSYADFRTHLRLDHLNQACHDGFKEERVVRAARVGRHLEPFSCRSFDQCLKMCTTKGAAWSGSMIIESIAGGDLEDFLSNPNCHSNIHSLQLSPSLVRAYGPNLQEILIKRIGSFTQLAKLHISNGSDRIDSELLPHLPTSLQELNLSESYFDDLSALKRLVHLKKLSLTGSKDTMIGVDDLPLTLEELTLQPSPYPGQIREVNLKKLDHLKRFSACQNTLTQQSIDSLPSSIQELDLRTLGTQVRDYSVLKTMTRLEILSITHRSNLDQISPGVLPTSLRQLTLDNLDHVVSPQLLAPLEHLESLSIDALSDQVAGALPASLQSISLNNMYSAKIPCGKLNISHLRNLTRLNVTGLYECSGLQIALPKQDLDLRIDVGTTLHSSTHTLIRTRLEVDQFNQSHAHGSEPL